MTPKKIVEIISCLLIVLFLYAALSKGMDYQKFVVQMGQSPMISDYAFTLGWIVPGVELIISCLLIIEKFRLYGLFASLALMTMFTVYIILASTFSDYVPCSCGGIIQNLTWTQHLIFNGGFIVLCIAGLLVQTASKDKRQILAE